QRARVRAPRGRGGGAAARHRGRRGGARDHRQLLPPLPRRAPGVTPSRVLLQCRAGFEKECAQEITAAAGAMGVEGFVKAKPESGYAVFQAHQDDMGAELGKHLEFRRLVFARQMVRVGELLTDLPESDRVTPIVAAVRALGKRWSALWIE